MNLPNKIEIGTKGFVATIAAVLTSLVAFAGLHSEYLVPRILAESRKQTEIMIDQHEDNPHPVSVSRREFNMLLARIDKVEDAIGNRFDRLEAKLDSK